MPVNRTDRMTTSVRSADGSREATIRPFPAAHARLAVLTAGAGTPLLVGAVLLRQRLVAAQTSPNARRSPNAVGTSPPRRTAFTSSCGLSSHVE